MERAETYVLTAASEHPTTNTPPSPMVQSMVNVRGDGNRRNSIRAILSISYVDKVEDPSRGRGGNE